MLFHALGLDRSKESYRNRYTANRNDPDCFWLEANGLFQRGLYADPTEELVTWHVTLLGKLCVAAFSEARLSKLNSWVEMLGTRDTDVAIALERMGVFKLYRESITNREWAIT
jgi:hypothetical protein